MASPTIRLRRLGSELQRLRKDAEYSGAQLAKAIGTSQTKLSSVEGARRKLSSGELEKAIRALRVPDTKARELRLLLEESNQLGWWEEYSDVLPDTIEMLAGLEDAASWVRRYDEAFIPALLQTPEYARAVVHAAAPYQRSGDMPRLVEFRMERQRRLRDSTFRFTSLINEGALRRQVGGREVMAAQLDQLLRLDHSTDVEVFVLPFEAGEQVVQGQTFAVLTFPEDQDPDVVFSESVATSGFIESYPSVRRHSSAFDTAFQQALGLDDSRSRIEQIAHSMIR